MQRFCILRHDFPFWHWDFLLEAGNHAECWRLLREPCGNEPIAAEHLPPHRLLYLEYEGPVSNDRGTVRRFAWGTYRIIEPGPHLSIELTGLNWAQQACLTDTRDGRLFWSFDAK
ncbi:MAG TPA: DNA polymerase ligase N-terminal domain-containing protein [Planctomycetaceae bacterium]|nr:DNA polymerase ligase N-terminal domain-containing protein [Planctomycetaceae bacterium]HRA88537.1 DNA polymerase ligase N-terminal domain-containing protein [Planctomycetaceae bacterium]